MQHRYNKLFMVVVDACAVISPLNEIVDEGRCDFGWLCCTCFEYLLDR